MSFTGNPGPARPRWPYGWRKSCTSSEMSGAAIAVTRDELVGQYIGRTAPRTKEVLKKAMGGVLFIDEAYYLYRQENERDYGQEAIEILLQVMENNREDLVVIPGTGRHLCRPQPPAYRLRGILVPQLFRMRRWTSLLPCCGQWRDPELRRTIRRHSLPSRIFQ